MQTGEWLSTYFNNPNAQLSLAANTFTITSHAETQPLTEMPPGFLDHLDIEKLKDTGRSWMEKHHLLLGRKVILFRVLMRLPIISQIVD